jgi:outer membrane protein TolC
MFAKSKTKSAAALAALIGTIGAPGAASALQPVEEFVRSAHQHNPSNLEASANRESASAVADETLGRALPGVTVTGSYTHNQYETAFAGLTITPMNQVDGVLTLAVPLVDLSKYARIASANRGAAAAGEGAKATDLHVESRVVQDYYQLAASLALVEAARTSLESAQANLQIVRDWSAAGSATLLDVERANAEVERQSQQLTTSELSAKVSARSLESDSGVTANAASRVTLEDDLRPEAPLDRFLASVAATPDMAAASLARRAADDSARAQELSLVPRLDGTAALHATNATAYLANHHVAYAVGATLSWSFDFSTMPAIHARRAEAVAARAREDRTRLVVGDAIYQVWHTVDADIARSRSARVQAEVSAHAADLARARYKNGAGTQLDLIQADRDAFSANAARIQADADLLNARAQLRIACGVDPFLNGPKRP